MHTHALLPMTLRIRRVSNCPMEGERPPSTAKAALGFSLIEVIGVLAVLAILATIIFSATTKSINVGMSKQESSTLQSFAAALQNSILRNRYIPGLSDWYQAIANEMGVSPNAVLYNSRNLASPRVLMIDPNLALGPLGTNRLSYRQGPGGSIEPTNNCRVMILSSLGAPLPSAGTDTTNFAAVWNTPDGSLPSSGFAGWNPDDLKIQRINLGPLFVNLQLANYFSGGSQGVYVIDRFGSVSVPATGTNTYYLQNTVVQLIEESLEVLDATVILRNDCACFYVDHIWRDVPYPPLNVQTNPVALALAQMMSASAVVFASSPANINAGSTTPLFAMNKMSNFMYTYAQYAPDGATNGWSKDQLYINAKASQTALQSALQDLSANIAQGGCQ